MQQYILYIYNALCKVLKQIKVDTYCLLFQIFIQIFKYQNHRAINLKNKLRSSHKLSINECAKKINKLQIKATKTTKKWQKQHQILRIKAKKITRECNKHFNEMMINIEVNNERIAYLQDIIERVVGNED